MTVETPCMASCGPSWDPDASRCGLAKGHVGRQHMPRNPVLRHGPGCARSGHEVGTHKGAVPLSDFQCVCDPYGDKARAHALVMDRYQRRQVLWQDEVWYQEDGTEVRVADMSLDRMQALVLFLERRAPRLKVSWEWSVALSPGVQGEHALDAVDQMLAESHATDAVEWIHDTPLVRRLDRRVAKQRAKSLRRDFEVVP
jgi:hypothetical protein